MPFDRIDLERFSMSELIGTHATSDASLDETLVALRGATARLVSELQGRSAAIDGLLRQIGLCGDLEYIMILLERLENELATKPAATPRKSGAARTRLHI